MKNKQRTQSFHYPDTMVPSEDGHQTPDYSRVSPNEDFLSPAGSEIPTPSSEEDSVKIDRLENKLYSVVELLEEAIIGHHKLRTEILPRQRFKFDQLCDKLQKSLSQIKAVMELNTSDVRKGLPNENNNICDYIVDSDRSRNRFTITMYGDTIKAQVDEFVNWHKLWQANLIKDLEYHSKETSQKLCTLTEEAARIDCNMKVFQWDDRQSQQTSNPFASILDQYKSGAIYEYHHRIREQKPNGHRIDEPVEFMDRSHSNTLELHSDRISKTSIPTNQTDSQVAESEVLCVPIASISLVSPDQLRISKMDNTSTSTKLQHIFTTLQRKREEQSLSTIPNPQEVRSLRAAANQEIQELWKSIETHRVEVLPDDSLCLYMRTLVLLSLMVEEKEMFYEHVLYCAQQLRNPANVDELAVVTTSSTDVNCVASPSVDWSAYKSSRSEYLVSLLPQEKRFYREVTKLKPKTLVIWCSAYACLLLRLGDRGVGYVRRQLSQLNRQLADAYMLDEPSLPRVPLDSPWFVDRLRQYSNYAVDPVRKHTLYKGLIERYECTVLPQRTKKLLNFLLLTSLRYRGMSLITLVDECRKLYGISLGELVRNTLADETRTSWQTYERFTSTFVKGSLCKEYKYCEVFRPQMYSGLHFNVNFELCLLLCVLIDIRKQKNGCGSSTVLYHKVVKRVRANDDSQPRVDARWKQKCVQIVKKFINYQ